jgi:hypothetical protein
MKGMITVTKKVILMVLGAIGIILISQVFAHGNNSTYEYPYAADSPEWSALSRQERLDACQIPEEILRGMSTEALIDTVLAYPMRADLLVFETYRQGFTKIYEEFNGLRELVSRDGAGLGLLEKYMAMKVGEPETITEMMFIEVILAQREFTAKTDQTIIDKIEEEARNKFQEKEKFPGIYGISKNTYFQAVQEQGLDPGVGH